MIQYNDGVRHLLYIGVAFILLGLYTMFEDSYDFKLSFENRELVKIENTVKDGYLKVKSTLGLFCCVVGLLSIVNYIFY